MQHTLARLFGATVKCAGRGWAEPHEKCLTLRKLVGLLLIIKQSG